MYRTLLFICLYFLLFRSNPPLYNPLREQNGNILKRIKGQVVYYQLLILYSCTQSRDRTGMEVNPLVFETSASTNSAIWA